MTPLLTDGPPSPSNSSRDRSTRRFRLGIATFLGIALLAGAVTALASARATAAAPSRWECTRVKVPESINLPLRMGDGKVVSPPTELGPSFRPYLSTVVLPDGFAPFGGGDGSVIACRQGL